MNHTHLMRMLYAPVSVFNLVIEYVPPVNSGSNAYGFITKNIVSCGTFGF